MLLVALVAIDLLGTPSNGLAQVLLVVPGGAHGATAELLQSCCSLFHIHVLELLTLKHPV